MKRTSAILLLLVATLPVLQASRKPRQDGDQPISSSEKLPAGKFEWEPGKHSSGSLAILVSLPKQMIYVYRGGDLIARSSVSSGRPGHTTPSGLFPILGKEVMHYSNLYQHAPMPWMQRLTMGGVALHAGYLPGEPASHGCIRLPNEFARRLFEITECGDPVMVVGRQGDIVRGAGKEMPPELAGVVQNTSSPVVNPPTPPLQAPSAILSSPVKPDPHPASVPSHAGKTMAQLEEEELKIRNDASLDRQARRDALLRIWADQRALMGKP